MYERFSVKDNAWQLDFSAQDFVLGCSYFEQFYAAGLGPSKEGGNSMSACH
jgi:hypothetical protein